jgi:hypothetical protein
MEKRILNLGLTINTNFDDTKQINNSPKTSLLDKNKKKYFDGKKIHQHFYSNGELWLGDYEDSKFASGCGIDVIINTAYECKTPLLPNQIIYEHYLIKDDSYQDISIITEIIPKKIQEYMNDGKKILVHCKKGISRSASCIIAYLMKYNNLKHDEAYKYVLSIKNNIDPNFGFKSALENLENS